MTWKSLAKRTNSLPEGWSTADEIATDLDCEVHEVPKILASAIRDGLVEKQNFPTWQPGSRQLLYQTGYRQRPPGQPVAEKPTKSSSKNELIKSVLSAAARHPGMPPGRLREYLPKRLRQLTTTTQVAAILGKA
jgi:hypothetical protein